jgi:glutathione peroxidase
MPFPNCFKYMKKAPLFLILALLTLTLQSWSQDSFYDFTVKDIKGSDFLLSELKGKKVLVVNTASNCGLTPQYEDLEALFREYKEEDFVIIGFPSNDFASQEPGTNSEIAAFCTEKFDVTFPMMEKISVKGDEIHPLYAWLTTEEMNGLEDSKVAWNFQKYMIDADGGLVGHVSPRKKPDSKEILSWINEEKE